MSAVPRPATATLGGMTTTDRPPSALDPAQVDGLLDMDPEAFRAAAHAVVALMADSLATIEDRAVFPNVEPGTIAPQFEASPPEQGEPLDAILDDYRRLGQPNAPALAQPGSMASCSSSPTRPPGSTRASWPTSRRPRRDRASLARC